MEGALADMFHEYPLEDYQINTWNPNWLKELQDLKYKWVKNIIIAVSQLSPENMTEIMKEAVRRKCHSLSFQDTNFVQFKGITAFDFLSSINVVHFKHCHSVDLFLPQILNNRNKVNVIGFENSGESDDLIMKYHIEVELRQNYRVREISFMSTASEFSVLERENNDILNRDINRLMRRNIVCRLNCQDSILTILMIKRFQTRTLFNHLPRDIVLIIARLLRKTRRDPQWLLDNNKSVNDSTIDLIYNKHKLSRRKQELLTIAHYSGSQLEYLEPLEELRRKKITLNKFVLLVSDKDNSHYNKFIFTSSMCAIFEALIDTNTHILEIRDINFTKMTHIPVRRIKNKETLNGDNSEIRGIELNLTEVHLINCSNICHFLSYLLCIIDKTNKYKDERFSYDGISLKDIDPDMTYSISLFIERRWSTIYIEQLSIE